MTYCTARSVPPRSIPGLEKPKAPTFASYTQSQLAAMLMADATRLPRYQRKEETDTRATIMAAMASLNGQEATFDDVKKRCPKMAESTLRKWLHRLANEGTLIKGNLTGEKIQWKTYRLPVTE